MTRFPNITAPILLLGLLVARGAAGADQAVVVEPGELARRPDLIGREVIVDDRIKYFLESRRGQGYDQLVLKRTDVPFLLPTGLRLTRAPSEPNAVVRGTLKVVDGRLVGEAITLELLPSDLERFDREVGRLRPDDFAGRRTWASWARRRGRELAEPKLVERGVAAEANAFWIEAERPGADPIALADGVADRPIPATLRSAIYHRGFRRAEATVRTPAEAEDLARRVGLALPRSTQPQPARAVEPHDPDPAANYRAAGDDDERAYLDRQLYADVLARSFDLRLQANPADAANLAVEAMRSLPDRPALADGLRRRGLAEAERGVAGLRQSEVEELARTFRAAGEEDRARRVLEAWLADRRKNRLSDSDAEGRILLAANYEKLLGDRATAGQLLAEGLAIEPESRGIAEAYLRLGYRKGEDGWYDPTTSRPPAPNPDPRAAGAAEPARGSLQGLAPAQVRLRMGGRPDRVVRSATQAIVTEQWIYRSGPTEQVILFRIDSATTEPRVSASYAVSR